MMNYGCILFFLSTCKGLQHCCGMEPPRKSGVLEDAVSAWAEVFGKLVSKMFTTWYFMAVRSCWDMSSGATLININDIITWDFLALWYGEYVLLPTSHLPIGMESYYERSSTSPATRIFLLMPPGPTILLESCPISWPKKTSVQRWAHGTCMDTSRNKKLQTYIDTSGSACSSWDWRMTM